ncbi:hypothetical protein QZH41_003779 [Actinostola sp. cb2023]|nr:hypothetical protein QZH41_003779 [Actinostola sp. cb2023]
MMKTDSNFDDKDDDVNRRSSSSSAQPEQDSLANLSTEVLRLRLQANNLSLHGSRQQMLARLRGVALPRNVSKASKSSRSRKPPKRSRRSTTASTSAPLDDEQNNSSSSDPESEPEARSDAQSAFSPEQVAVIQETIQASLAAWQPPQAQQPAYQLPQLAQARSVNPPTHAGTASPIGLDRPLDEALQDKLIRGEYIDLALLLPDSLQVRDDSQYKFGVDDSVPGSAVKLLRTKKPLIDSFYKWIDAYTRYMSIIINTFPRRALEMVRYQAIICRGFATYKGFAWLTYDESFRRRRAAHDRTIPWDRIDLELWTVTFAGLAKPHCTVCFSPYHKQEDCPSGDRRSPHSNTARPKQVCYDYNKPTGCSRTACVYSHACQRCSATGHPAFQCRTKDGTRPGSKGPSSGRTAETR